MVDMPLCFQKSKSLFSKTFEIPLLKLINMVMRHGLKNQTIKNITKSFSTCFHQSLNFFNNPELVRWFLLYNSLLSVNLPIFESKFFINTTHRDLKTDITAKHVLTPAGYSFNDLFFLKNLLFEKLSKYLPLFSFYIRKVDKSIRKNSRNKSGKYTIVWKYVPSFKRLYVTVRWLLQDLKFQKLKTFNERFIKIIETFLLTPHLSFVSRLRKFTHFFVFENYRKSLLKSLKSTS